MVCPVSSYELDRLNALSLRTQKGASAAVLSMVPLVVSGVGVGLLFGID